MPETAVFMTQAEYDGIMARLAALDAALPARSTDIDAIKLRIQSVESTLSAFAKRMSEWPVTTKGGSPL